MAGVSIYLNFPGQTEEAFKFYREVFGSEFAGNGIMRFSDVPADSGSPALSPETAGMVMHVTLPIMNGFKLMGSDAPKEMGFAVKPGNNFYINLEPDTRKETKKLFGLLSSGGEIEQELTDMFWGDYYGACTDKFGIKWMFNCSEKENKS